MSIAVTAPSGNIGSRLTERLLDAGREVTLLARSPAKLERFQKRGARIEHGDLHDRDFVVKSTRGARALFWLTPTDTAAQDIRAGQKRLGQVAAEAIKANRIERVVNLSSMGAQLGKGTGPVDGLYDVEKSIDSAAFAVTHLRPGFFMENFYWQAQSIRQEGAIYMPMPGKTRVPLIATRDIAKAAADRLLDEGWTGRAVLPLQGPDTLSFDEAAEVISSALGWPLKYVQIPYERAKEHMANMGASEDAVARFMELYKGLETGYLYSGRPEAEKVTTETSFQHFAAEELKRVIQG
jgi:uncharacterized protein YbjT (DUF2867 family)